MQDRWLALVGVVKALIYNIPIRLNGPAGKVGLFPALSRITDMIGTAAMQWEGHVGLEADVAQLRRGDLDALSTLVSRYQNRYTGSCCAWCATGAKPRIFSSKRGFT